MELQLFERVPAMHSYPMSERHTVEQVKPSKTLKKLTKLTFQTSLFCFRLATLLKIVPFNLCSSSGRLKVRKYEKQWQILVWYAVNALVLVNSFYQIVSFFWSVEVNGFTSETAVHLFYFCMALMPPLFFTPTLLMRAEAVAVINQLDAVIEISKSKAHFAQHYLT